MFKQVEFTGLGSGLDVTGEGGIKDDCPLSDLKEWLDVH